MGIFRRKRRGADVAADAQAVESKAAASDLSAPQQDDERQPHEQVRLRDEEQPADGGQHATGAAGEPPEPEPAPSFERGNGPFDVDDDVTDADRLDLGSLQVPAVEGLMLQLDLDEATASVTAVRLLLGGSQAQLQAFAAPRSAVLWPSVRAEIAAGVDGTGGSAEVVAGPLGPELVVRAPADSPPLRLLGVDGPRWLLRAVLSGPAATDPDAAAPLLDLIRGTVVVRGGDAMAPRELLPLQLPAVEQAAQSDETAGRAALDPFERGPEITEVR